MLAMVCFAPKTKLNRNFEILASLIFKLIGLLAYNMDNTYYANNYC